MASLYPEVGMKGTLSALPPYSVDVQDHIQYECMAVESLASVLARGDNPYELYYKPKNIDESKYQQDLDAGAKLVTLQAYTGQYLKIPSTYLSGLPDPSGAAYRMFGLSVALNALPIDTDLGSLKSDIKDLVSARLGIECDVQELVYGPVAILTPEQDDRVRAARSSVIAGLGSHLAQVRKLAQANSDLQQKLTALEAYIGTHYITP